jgi:flavin reductase (DIM6/NTAB) family NADH-FMN oxidoreductase RutF
MRGPRPPVDDPVIDKALGLIPAPVCVVGIERDGVTGGMTAAWVTRVSHRPPLLIVAIGHQRYTHELFADGAEFTVSVLAEDQVAVGRLFGLHSRRDRDKWAEVDHVRLGGGAPALQRCAARLLCRVVARFATGDHDCFVGEVRGADVVDGPPALPMRGADYAP